jgi:predicted RNA methylase
MQVTAQDGISLLDKVKNQVGERGFYSTVKYSVGRVLDLLQEGWFDWRHRVVTSGVAAPAGDGGYKAVPVPIIRGLIENLPLRYEDYTFIDLGSGKGRALLVAAEYPFRSVIGVEYNKEFQRIAEANIERYRSRTRKCESVHALFADVRSFEFPDGPLAIYLYNPFGASVLRDVLENLRMSLEKSPRPALVAYFSPCHEHVLHQSGFLHRIMERRSDLVDVWNTVVYRADAVRCGETLPG